MKNQEIEDDGELLNKQDEQKDVNLTIQQRQEQVIIPALTLDVQGTAHENL